MARYLTVFSVAALFLGVSLYSGLLPIPSANMVATLLLR